MPKHPPLNGGGGGGERGGRGGGGGVGVGVASKTSQQVFTRGAFDWGIRISILKSSFGFPIVQQNPS